MINNPKTLVDMGFNVATMAAFAMPGGPAIAAGLAGAQAVFDIFFHVPNRQDPGAAIATKNDLTNSVNQIKLFVLEANFQAQLEIDSATLQTLNDQLREVWSANHELNPRAQRGPLSHGQFSVAQVNTWKKEIDGYSNVIMSNPSLLLNIINWIEIETNYANQTIDLYLFAGSLWNIYCRLNIAFEYNMALMDYNQAMLKYKSDYSNYNRDHKLWSLSDNPTPVTEPLEPIEPTEPKDDTAFLNNSVFASKVDNYLGGFISYADPKVTQLEADFKARENGLKSRCEQVTLKQVNGGWCYHDAGTNKDSTPHSKIMATTQMNIYLGTLRAATWHHLTTQLKLEGVKKEQIETMKNTIAVWKKTKQNYAPN